MAAETKVAKRYAKALFELCSPSQMDQMRDALAQIAQCWSENAMLRDALLNPAIPQAARYSILDEMSARFPVEHKTLSNFLCVLLENKRLQVISAISRTFAEIIAAYKKLLSLEITSAFEMPEQEKEAIQRTIQNQFGATASIKWHVDRTLLGGLLIKSGDTQLDSTVRGSLEMIHAELLGA